MGPHAKKKAPARQPAKKAPNKTHKPVSIPKDLALLQGPTEDGEGARLLRLKEGTLFAGEVRPAREGQDLGQHELVRLKPLAERSPLCEVETLHAPQASKAQEPARRARKHGGPARVSNDTYRKNWSTVFGGAKRVRADWTVN